MSAHSKKQRSVFAQSQRRRSVSAHRQRSVSAHSQRQRSVSAHSQRQRSVSIHSQRQKSVSAHSQRQRSVSAHRDRGLFLHTVIVYFCTLSQTEVCVCTQRAIFAQRYHLSLEGLHSDCQTLRCTHQTHTHAKIVEQLLAGAGWQTRDRDDTLDGVTNS